MFDPPRYVLGFTVLCFMVSPAVGIGEEAADELAERLAEANAAVQAGDPDEALRLVNKAVEGHPENVDARLLRAQLLASRRDYPQAIADCDRCIALDATVAHAHYIRARCHFARGQLEPCLADFHRYLQLVPQAKSRLWEYGIALYYADQHEKGARQFALYQEAFADDVENAVWRYLCMARGEGVDKARADILPIENDRRVPMMEIYRVFRGEVSPKDVLDAAQRGTPNPERLNHQLFYAHLYLGLFHESQGDAKRAQEHVRIARDKHPIGHYMWDVANVHNKLRYKLDEGQNLGKTPRPR